MKFPSTLFLPALLFFTPLQGQESGTTSSEGEVFEYHVGAVNYLTGEGVNLGGFLFPSLFVNATGGVIESGAGAGEFATHEHDPLNDVGIQGIELHIDLNFNEAVTGLVSGFGHQGEDHEWEAELEEAYLHWHLNEELSLGGGQFLNTFGFQSNLHLHDWSFVNQSLPNTRMLSEGELITQGGEILVRTPHSGLLTFGFGGVRSHGHGHDDDDDDDEHHLEIDEAGFENWLWTMDYRFRLPCDDSITGSASLAHGGNGFGRDTFVFGVGLRKVWNGHDHGHGGPDFCSGALMLQSEFIGRSVNALDEDDDEVSFNDRGFSTSLHYGLSDRTTVSLRHDWVSAIELAELSDRHRLSAALTTFVDPAQRVRARVQYDYTHDRDLGPEHAAWFQVQLQWGGIGGSHAGHGH